MDVDLEIEDEFFEDSGGGFDLDLLLSVAGGLGRFQYTDSGKKVYVKDSDCVACLKDLQRFLRRDDPDTRDAFFKLGELQVASAHLVPLLVTYPHDEDLAFNALKVLTFLTMPADLYTESPLLQLQYMRDAKEAMLARDALAAVVGLTAGPLSRHPRMTDEGHMTVQLVITFIRNLLAIPDPPASEARSGGRRSRMQAELLGLLLDESALELVALVAGHVRDRPFKGDAPLLLDTLHEVFKGTDPAEAAAAEEPPPPHARGAPPPQAPRPRPKPQGPPVSMRHGRFKSTIVTRHADCARATFERVGGGKPLGAPAPGPPPAQVLNTKVPEAPSRALGPALLYRLRRYAESLLEGPYNVLMGQIRTELEPGLGISRLETSDFVKWMAFASWATGFLRAKEERALEARGGKRLPAGAPSPFGCISATLGWETFAIAHKLWVAEADVPPGRNAANKNWPLQHGATRLLREALGVLDLAERCGSEDDAHAAERLARRLLHDDMKESGLLPVLAKLIKKFNARFEPRGAAVVLAEAVHVVLRLYDRLSAKEGGKFYVRARRVAGGRRRKLAGFGPEPDAQPPAAAIAGAADGAAADGERDPSQGGGQAPDAAAAAVEAGGGGAAAGPGPGPDTAEPAGGASTGAAAEGEAAAACGAEAPGGGAGPEGAARPPASGGEAPAAAARGEAPDPFSDDEKEERREGGVAAAAAERGASPVAAPTGGEGETGGAAEGAEGRAAAGAPEAAAADAAEGAASRGASAEPAAAPAAPDAAAPGARAGSEEPAASAAAGAAAPQGPGGAAEEEDAAALLAGAALEAHQRWRERDPLEELEEEYESGDEGGRAAAYAEVALDLKKRTKQELAVPSVVHFYLWLLQGYDCANSAALNHALCSFLWRLILPEHLNLEPMLYQLSALRLFYRALADPSLRGQPQHKELLLLSTRVTRGLFSRLVPPADPAAKADDSTGGGDGGAARRLAFEEGEGGGGAAAKEGEAGRAARVKEAAARMAFVELLFFKTARDADVMREDYYLGERLLAAEPGAAKGGKGAKGRRGAAAGGAGAGAGGAAGAGGDWGDEGAEFGDGFGPGGDGDASGAEGGARPARARKPPPALLSGAGEEKLLHLFEGMCADKGNLQRLTDALGISSLSTKQVARELRRLGLKFGQLPARLAPKLAELWAAARGKGAKGEDLAEVARQLPGGWTPKQVRKLLKEHGLLGGPLRARGRRGGGAGAGSGSDGGWASEVEGGDPLLEVEREAVEDLYCRHLAHDDYLERIAAELPADLGATPASVLATLRFMGIAARPPPGKKRAPRPRGGGGGGERRGRRAGDGVPAVPKALLADLWESHRGAGDALNMVAMELGCGVMQVRKLLQKHGLGDDSSSSDSSGASDGCGASDGSASDGDGGSGSDGGRRGAAPKRGAAGPKEKGGKHVPVAKDQLESLYARYKDDADCLERIAERLPVPASAKQVALWLKASGVAAAPKPAAKGAPKPAAPRAAPRALTQGAANAGGAAGGPTAGAVPEPQPAALLGLLEAVELAHRPGSSWMGAQAAVGWILSKLKAAEEVWGALEGTGAVLQDYALVPSGDTDLDFFCTDWSNELLEAAGIRNDSGDYFKIPVRGGAGWRAGVRAALTSALAKVGSDEADAARAALRLDERAARAAADAERARADEEAAAAAAAAEALFKGSAKKRAGGEAGGARGRKRRSDASEAAASDEDGSGGGGGGAERDASGDGGCARKPRGGKRAKRGAAGGTPAAGRARGGGGAAAAGPLSDSDADSEPLAAAPAAPGGSGAKRGGRRAAAASAFSSDEGSEGSGDEGAAPGAAAGNSQPLAPAGALGRRRAAAAALSDDSGDSGGGGGARRAPPDSEALMAVPPDSEPMFERDAAAAAAPPPPPRARGRSRLAPGGGGAGEEEDEEEGGGGGGAQHGARQRLSAAKRGALEEITRRRQSQAPGSGDKQQKRRGGAGADGSDRRGQEQRSPRGGGAFSSDEDEGGHEEERPAVVGGGGGGGGGGAAKGRAKRLRLHAAGGGEAAAAAGGGGDPLEDLADF